MVIKPEEKTPRTREEIVRDAIWDALCPGIRRTDEDDALYMFAARRALKVLDD